MIFIIALFCGLFGSNVCVDAPEPPNLYSTIFVCGSIPTEECGPQQSILRVEVPVMDMHTPEECMGKTAIWAINHKIPAPARVMCRVDGYVPAEGFRI